MTTSLIDVETKYFRELGRPMINCNVALSLNNQYYAALFELYENTTDAEDKVELSQELEYLCGQAAFLLGHDSINIQGGNK